MDGHYRLEALSMSGWCTRRHLTLDELASALAAAQRDPIVTTRRVLPDTPPGTWVSEFDSK